MTNHGDTSDIIDSYILSGLDGVGKLAMAGKSTEALKLLSVVATLISKQTNEESVS